MDFMEAVKAMKEGKRVRRSIDSSDFYLSTELTKGVPMFYYNGKLETKLYLSFECIDATDWEIVDEDKDWVLAEQNIEHANNPLEENTYFHKDVKKCRDLILKDIKQLNKEWGMESNKHLSTVMLIVDKRFGDLK